MNNNAKRNTTVTIMLAKDWPRRAAICAMERRGDCVHIDLFGRQSINLTLTDAHDLGKLLQRAARKK